MAQTSNDEAAKQRIITHMNEDHHDSIVRYLEHYANLPSWTAHDGKMTAIELDSMTMECSGQTYHIPFDPPMRAFRDARERVVEMDKHCLQALEKSDITVKEFVPPTGIYALEFLIIATTFIAYSQRHWFERGKLVEQFLGTGFAKFSWIIQPWVITLMLGLHTAELAHFIRSRLRKHSVNVRTALWWKWTVFTFVEGQFAFKRFDDLVRRKKEEKQKQKH